MSKISSVDFVYFAKVIKYLGLNLSGVTYYQRYTKHTDITVFNDFVSVIDGKFITICEILDVNKDRYHVLHHLNEYFKSNPTELFEPSDCYIFDYDDKTWFFEGTSMYDHTPSTSADDILKIWHMTSELNNLVADATKSLNFPNHNKLYREVINEDFNFNTDCYTLSEINRLKSDTPFLQFTDFEKTFELSRLKTPFSVTGLQSFLPVPASAAKVSTVLFSTFKDSIQGIVDKLSILNSVETQILKQMVDSRIDGWTSDPSFCYNDTNVTIPHLHRIKDLL